MGTLLVIDIQKHAFVEVKWLDAEATPAWTTATDTEDFKAPLVITRGWLVKKTKKQVILAMGYHGDSWLNTFIIPGGMLESLTKLEIPNGG